MSPASPQPDFLRPAARPGGLAWAWCATGLLVLAVSAADSHDAWQARLQAHERLARAPAGSAPTGSLPAPPGTATSASARLAQQARQAEAARWLQQLALPWPVVWAAGEAAPVGVQWLLLDHGASTGLRLAGLATDQAAAEAATAAVRQQPQAGQGAWQGVALAAVERGPNGLRFEVVARLGGPGAGAGADAQADAAIAAPAAQAGGPTP